MLYYPATRGNRQLSMEGEENKDNLLTKNAKKLQTITSEASQVSRRIQKQLSKSEQDEKGEEGEDLGEEDEDKAQESTMHPAVKCGLYLMLSVLIFATLLSIAMLTVGSVYFTDCKYSFYPTWLIACGAPLVGVFILVIIVLLLCADGLTGGGSNLPCFEVLYGITLLFIVLDVVFMFVWYIVGCYYIWGGETGETVLAMTEEGIYKYDESCRNLYYFVYAIIVLPLVLVGVCLPFCLLVLAISLVCKPENVNFFA